MSSRVCIWGTGFGIERLLGMLREGGVEVLAFLDNNPLKWGMAVSDVPAMSPDNLTRLAPDYLVVASMAFKAIRKQAVALGFPVARILDYHADKEKTLRRVGGRHCVFYDSYAVDGETLIPRLHKHVVRGKAVRNIPSPVPLRKQVALAERLLSAFLRAKEHGEDVPPAYHVGQNWGSVLANSRGQLYDAVRKQDARELAGLLANFCRNDLSYSILGGVQVFEDCKRSKTQKWLQHNLDVWMGLVDSRATLEEAAMPPIGNPYGYDVDGMVINWNSYVNHARAYRCAKLLEGVRRPVVAEIGGGFGGFAYHFMRRVPNSVYIDFDLPENGMIASYYLSMAYPDKRILLFESPGITLDEALLEKYDAIMMPNYMLPKLADLSVDFFINTISLSEMDMRTISEYIHQIDRTSRKYFYNENLTCKPPYKGFPSAVFPEPPNFRQLFATYSSWQGFDAYSPGHSYVERLYERIAR